MDGRAAALGDKAPCTLAVMARHAILIGIAVVFMTPIVFIVLTAVMSDAQALSPALWPRPFHWSNFAAVFRAIPFWRYTVTTLTVAAACSVGTVLSSVPVAYALSHLRWRGRQATFVLILVTYLLPIQVTIIPSYLVFSKLGWIGSLKPLIVPSFFGDAFSIFLLRQFFRTIPSELLDAARVEGAGEVQVLLRVVVPLARPAIVAVGLFSFFYAWNQLFLPLLYVDSNPKLWTLPLALSTFRSQHQVEWNLTMAASVLFMLPVIGLFLVAQRWLIAGVTLTGRGR
ncbi:MAG: multiple sugar transport system permease protein [Actinomycetota bacterium]|jgi:multiple sugar transport system permease protein|nr:multiple sugar transport system permease protein [Actinomycetota bacterium]